MTLEEERQRREAALIELENLVGKLRLFIHGTADDVVPTQNGPIKTLAALANFNELHESEVESFIDEITTTMDSLAPIPQP